MPTLRSRRPTRRYDRAKIEVGANKNYEILLLLLHRCVRVSLLQMGCMGAWDARTVN